MQPFPLSLERPVTFPGPPPDDADVVVIGGGVIGVCTALYLAEAGQRVVLLEKGRIAAEQSSRNWGWVRQQMRDPGELPIMIEAAQLWHDLAARTNVDIGLRRAGVSYFAQDPAQLARYEAWLPEARAAGLDSRMLSQAEIATRFDGMATPVLGALCTPSDMRAEPWVTVPAFAGIAARAGATLVEDCAVRALDLEAGRVVGVVTEHGRIKAPRVVLAGGAWSSLFLRNHGLSLPQLSVRQSVCATEPLPEVSAGAAAAKGVAFVRRVDGGYTLAVPGSAALYIGPDAFRAAPKYMPQLRRDPFGQTYAFPAPRGFPDAWGTSRRWGDGKSPFENMRVLNPAPGQKMISKLVRNFAQMFPDLPEIRIKSMWAGMIDTMPDVVPVVDHAPIDGLIVGTGMSGHGFGIGPGMGKVLAALAMGRDPGHDLNRFRYSRFMDGSPIRLDP